MLSRRLARPMLAAVFVTGGIDVLRNPQARAEKAAPVAPKLARPLGLPEDPTQLVRLNGAVQVGAGLLLALNRAPRLAAAVLAVSLVPTTLVGHRFWEEQDGAARSLQQTQFAKNVGLLGGLILAARDTEGAPSLGWWARRAATRTWATAAAAAASARSALPAG